jgi:hypothetical protein
MAKLRMIIPTKKPYRSYVPTELVEAGFSGEVDILTGAFTAVMIKPGTDDGEAIRSLSVTLQELGLTAGKRVKVTVGE